jgi:dihydroneopterin aldolase
MDDVLTIELNGLRFFARHGLYAGEKKTGNEFEVNLRVSRKPGKRIITELSQTTNYVQLYHLLETEMQRPRELLETFVMEMAEIIHRAHPEITRVEINITKLRPPIVRFQGSVSVSFVKSFTAH